jgi:hypothetical protein
MRKLLVYTTLGVFAINTLTTISFAEEILDLGDTTTATNTTANTGSDTLDLGLDDTQTQDTTTQQTTDTLDLGGDVNTQAQTTQQGDLDTQQTNQQIVVEYQKIGENEYKFNMPILDANKSYVVEFDIPTQDLTLTDIVINNGNISDNLKKSIEILVIDNQGNKKTYNLDDLDLKPITIPANSKVYLLYVPKDVDNTAELALLNNELKVYAKEITQPKIWGELQYDNAGNVIVANPVEYKEAQAESPIATYEPQVDNKEVKKEITKKDTGPVENTIMLIFALLALVLVGRYYIKNRV